MSKKLYVGNIEWRITSEQLSDFFQQAGDVSNATVILNRDTGRSRGFGFVEMMEEDGVRNAIETLNGIEFNGRPLIVNEARPEREASDVR